MIDNPWQPIESAPKDGTCILGYWDKSNSYGIVHYIDGRWSDPEFDDNYRIEWFAPDFWMPLPSPPPFRS